MALVAPPSNDRKRVKVYELKNNDWFDRGTGFCRGVFVNVGRQRWYRGRQILRARRPLMPADACASLD
jgi:hypothetical protein